MKEEWKDIIGYGGRYKISSFGRVWCNGEYADGRKYKPFYKKAALKFGYYVVGLYKNRETSRTISIHRLVAIHFIPNPENKPCVDHINGDKKDNNVTNLRWATYKENSNNPITHKRQIEGVRSARLNEQKSANMKRNILLINNSKHHPILQFTLDGYFIKKYHSLKEAADATNSLSSNILKVCKGIYKSHNGYIWKKE